MWCVSRIIYMLGAQDGESNMKVVLWVAKPLMRRTSGAPLEIWSGSGVRSATRERNTVSHMHCCHCSKV